ncbi:MAG: CdaR family protein [Candidatus Edwardsbacteria bacterium]
MFKWLINNIEIKIVALVIALLLWFHVATERTSTVIWQTSLRVRNLPRNLVLVTEIPSAIAVEFEGTGKQLLLLRFKPPYVEIDLSELKLPKNKIILQPEDVKLPAETKVLVKKIISPTTLELELDRLGSKKIRLFPICEGEPKEGFVLAEPPILHPSVVELSGPRKMLSTIDSLSTEKINLEELTCQTKQWIKLPLPNKELFKISPESVLVLLKVEEAVKEIIPEVIVQVVNREGNLVVSLQPQKINLSVVGPAAEIRKLEPSKIKAKIDLAGLKNGVYDLPAKIELPPSIALLEAEPKHFRVVIK